MKISLIYLAAGNSRRFGSNKLLYSLQGKPMYLHLLERLVRICARHSRWNVIVVTQYPEIMEVVKRFSIQGVFSGESRKGASWSVRAGLMAAEEQGDVEACVFFVADQPYFSEESAEQFLEYMERGRERLGCVCCKGQSGSPVWFAREYFAKLMQLEGDQGGRKVLKLSLIHI